MFAFLERPGSSRGVFLLGNSVGQASACPTKPPVQILRKIVCWFCAIPQTSVDIFSRALAIRSFTCSFSEQSSVEPSECAQHNLSAFIAHARFPHFHSDGYYYYLYTCTKTGYSSLSQKQCSLCLPAEEIQQWNSV